MTAKAGRDIKKGEHLSIMYTHSLWGTQARRAHLNDTKKFWCHCIRCSDATEFGTEFSSIVREGRCVQNVFYNTINNYHFCDFSEVLRP